MARGLFIPAPSYRSRDVLGSSLPRHAGRRRVTVKELADSDRPPMEILVGVPCANRVRRLDMKLEERSVVLDVHLALLAPALELEGVVIRDADFERDDLRLTLRTADAVLYPLHLVLRRGRFLRSGLFIPRSPCKRGCLQLGAHRETHGTAWIGTDVEREFVLTWPAKKGCDVTPPILPEA